MPERVANVIDPPHETASVPMQQRCLSLEGARGRLRRENDRGLTVGAQPSLPTAAALEEMLAR